LPTHLKKRRLSLPALAFASAIIIFTLFFLAPGGSAFYLAKDFFVQRVFSLQFMENYVADLIRDGSVLTTNEFVYNLVFWSAIALSVAFLGTSIMNKPMIQRRLETLERLGQKFTMTNSGFLFLGALAISIILNTIAFLLTKYTVTNDLGAEANPLSSSLTMITLANHLLIIAVLYLAIYVLVYRKILPQEIGLLVSFTVPMFLTLDVVHDIMPLLPVLFPSHHVSAQL
jgi:hypothetical protein